MGESPSLKKPETYEIEAYRACFKEKHHYDKLSWQIGAVTLAFVGFLLSRAPQIQGPSFLIKRLILWAFIVLFILFWKILYDRNRLWAETANEKARDFEREWGIEGVALKFMKVNKPKLNPDPCNGRPGLMLKNTDEKADPWCPEKPECGPKIPMHTGIDVLFWTALLLSLLFCLIS